MVLDVVVHGLRSRATLHSGLEGAAADLDVLAVHEALDALFAHDVRVARVAEARLFGGLTVLETAEALGVSPRLVDEEWSYARMCFARALS